MRRKIVILFVLLLSQAACETFSSDDSYEYETTDEGGKTHYLVSYNPHGLEPVVEIRRKSAVSRMESRCGRDRYKIISEEISAAGRDKDRTIDAIGTDTLNYIEYECKD